MKKILYVGLKYNYGKPAEGFSYEHMNIEAGLRDCVKRGICEAEFWYPDEPKAFEGHTSPYWRDSMHHWDAIFHVAFNESLDFPEEAAKFALKQDIPVIQWDCDSSWRFHNWIFPRKDRVSHFVTTHSATIPWYEKNGMKVIKSQWAASPLYLQYFDEHQLDANQYGCSFIGQKHGQMPNGKFLRSEIIDAMISAGIRIDLFGNYWDGYSNWHGYQTKFEDVMDVFNTTKVNLNLSNPWHHGTMPQIKGRHFEIPAISGFQISTPADDLSSYFVEDSEIVIARSTNELIEKTKYYLEHDEERNMIKCAGQLRTVLSHQWHHRFEHIFKEVGML